MWSKYSKHNPNNLESVLETEFTHKVSSITIIDWLQLIKGIHKGFLKTNDTLNALCPEACLQIFEWLYSIPMSHDFTVNFIPLNVFREIKWMLTIDMDKSRTTISILEHLDVLKNIKQLCDTVDSEIFQKFLKAILYIKHRN